MYIRINVSKQIRVKEMNDREIYSDGVSNFVRKR